jgi:hypothetical protein
LLPKVARIVLVILVVDFIAALLPRCLTFAAVIDSFWTILLKIISRRTRPTGIGPSGLTEIGCPGPTQICTIASARCARPIAGANRSAADASTWPIRGKLAGTCSTEKIGSRAARPAACSNCACSPNRASGCDSAGRWAGDIEKIA